MRLVREDLANEAIRAARTATEWPAYSIFVYLSCYDSIAIAPSVWESGGHRKACWHADLFVILREDWIDAGHPALALRNEEVFDGHLEWEPDGTFSVRTQRGEFLPPDLQAGIERILEELSGGRDE